MSAEAKAYFSRYGQQYAELKKTAPDQASEFLKTQRKSGDFHMSLFMGLMAKHSPRTFAIAQWVKEKDTETDKSLTQLGEDSNAHAKKFPPQAKKYLIDARDKYNTYGEIWLENTRFETVDQIMEFSDKGMFVIRNIANLAKESFQVEALEDEQRVYDKNNFPQGVDMVEKEKFTHFFPFMFEIDGVSLNTFLKQNFGKNNKRHPDSVKYLRLFTAALQSVRMVDTMELVDTKDTDFVDAMLEGEADIDISQYSLGATDFFRGAIEDLGNALTIFDPKITKDQMMKLHRQQGFRKGNPSRIEHVRRRMIEMHGVTSDFKSEIQKNLYEDTPQGEEIRAMINAYMKSHSDTGILSYIANNTDLVDLYRKSSAQQKDTDFHVAFALRVAERIADTETAIMPEDLNLIKKSGDFLKPAIAAVDLKPSVDALTMNRQWKDTVQAISPDSIDWVQEGFIKPTGIEVTFGQSPYEVNILLQYTTKEENIPFRFTTNIRKNTTDWNALEHESVDKDLQQRCLALVKTILDQSALKAKLNAQAPAKPQAIFVPIKKGEPIVRARKEERAPKVTPSANEKLIASVMAQVEAAPALKRTKINIPTKEILNQLMEDITDERIRKKLVNRMTRFNVDGLGDLKPLDNDSPSGNKAFSLREGKYRILFESDPNSNGDLVNPFAFKHRRIVYDEVDRY